MSTKHVTGAERRRLHRLAHPRVPSSLLLLRLMAAEGAITCKQARDHLDCELQSARNAIGKLVRQKSAFVTLGEGKGEFATYRITPRGCALIDLAEPQRLLDEAEAIEAEEALEAIEADEQLARTRANLEHARFAVPRSVFDFGRCLALAAHV